MPPKATKKSKATEPAPQTPKAKVQKSKPAPKPSPPSEPESESEPEPEPEPETPKQQSKGKRKASADQTPASTASKKRAKKDATAALPILAHGKGAVPPIDVTLELGGSTSSAFQKDGSHTFKLQLKADDLFSLVKTVVLQKGELVLKGQGIFGKDEDFEGHQVIIIRPPAPFRFMELFKTLPLQQKFYPWGSVQTKRIEDVVGGEGHLNMKEEEKEDAKEDKLSRVNDGEETNMKEGDTKEGDTKEGDTGQPNESSIQSIEATTGVLRSDSVASSTSFTWTEPDRAQIRQTIYKYYFAPSGVTNNPIILEGRRTTDRNVYAKSYSAGSKHRLALLLVHPCITKEATPILYKHSFRFSDTTPVLDFLVQTTPSVKALLTNIEMKSYVKTTARNALALLSTLPHLSRVSIDTGVTMDPDPEKAARAFYGDAAKFLEDVGMRLGRKEAMGVFKFGTEALQYKEKSKGGGGGEAVFEEDDGAVLGGGGGEVGVSAAHAWYLFHLEMLRALHLEMMKSMGW